MTLFECFLTVYSVVTDKEVLTLHLIYTFMKPNMLYICNSSKASLVLRTHHVLYLGDFEGPS